MLQPELRQGIDRHGHFPVSEQVDEIEAEGIAEVTERLPGTQNGIAVAQSSQRTGESQQSGANPVPVIDPAETAQRARTVFLFHDITSRLPKAENEVPEKKHAEQNKQDFPDIFQYFHGFGILVNFFLVV